MRLLLHEFVTAGGYGPSAPASLRAEGAAMLAAVIDDFRRVPQVALTALIAHDAPGNWGPGCRRIAAGDEESAFCTQAARADATLVIAPECAGLLERRSRQVLAAGGQLLGCRPDAIRLAADKKELARWWQERGIATPSIIAESSDPPPALAFPLVCKPRHGAGSQATFLIARPADLHSALRAAQAEMPNDELLLQSLAPGRPASVAFFVGPAQTLALAPTWQRLSADGRFHYRGGQLPLPAPWNERALRLGRRALAGIDGLHGYVGVDLVLGEHGRDFAIEINPRLTTSYLGLRQLARDNLADIWLRMARGEIVEEIRWQTGPVEFTANPS